MPRKQKTIHYIYKTTCKVTNRYYIGMHSTNNLDDGYLGSGKRLRYSIRKYGKENHIKEILEFFGSRELLAEAEKNVITPEILIDKMCMNLINGGECGFNEENRRQGAKAMLQIIWQDAEFIKRHKERGRTKFKKLWADGVLKLTNFNGRKHSEETKKIISEKAKINQLGEKNSQYGTCWITNGNENKKIKKEEYNLYIMNGWIKGRKLK